MNYCIKFYSDNCYMGMVFYKASLYKEMMDFIQATLKDEWAEGSKTSHFRISLTDKTDAEIDALEPFDSF